MRNLVLAATLLVTAGCATTTGTISKADKTEVFGWASTRNLKRPNGSCPVNASSYRRDNVKNLMQYAWNCSLLEKWTQLSEVGDLLAQKSPNEPWGAYFLSVSSLGRKELQRASWMIDLAIKKSPKVGLLWYQKGRVHWDAADYHLALEAFDKATDLDPTLVDAHLILGEVYFRERNYKKAESHFAAVLKQESDNVPALSGIAEAKVHKGDIKDALAYLERAINASPRNVGLRLRLAGLYETETRDLEQALSVYKRIDALLGDRRVTEKVPFDLKAKIRDLEASLQKASPGRKVTNVEPEARVRQ